MKISADFNGSLYCQSAWRRG